MTLVVNHLLTLPTTSCNLQAVKGKETFLKVLHISSYGELYTSREFVNKAKEMIDSLKRSQRFQNMFVLSPLVDAFSNVLLAMLV